MPYTAFYYVLETGGGWKDTIGSADIILRLPYPASTQNVVMGFQIGWAETTRGGVIQGNEVRWHFDDFEPEQSNDFEISLVMPSAWQKVLKERANVNANPKDGEAWGRLGKLYKELILYRKAIRFDAGGQELYRLGVEAYERSVTLLPNDALGMRDSLTCCLVRPHTEQRLLTAAVGEAGRLGNRRSLDLGHIEHLKAQAACGSEGLRPPLGLGGVGGSAIDPQPDVQSVGGVPQPGQDVPQPERVLSTGNGDEDPV